MRIYSSRYGFTLLELMAGLLIVSILVTISVPLYTKYVARAQRSAAEGQMLKIAADLERWRSKALSYQGFTPETPFDASQGTIASAAKETIYLPIGSTSTNYKYQLAVLDGTDRTKSLSTGVGQRWVIVAQPNTSNAILNLASRLVLNSSGVKCLTDSAMSDSVMKSNITGSSDDASLCGSSSSSW